MSRSRDIANQATTLDVDGGTIKLDGNYPVGTENVALGDGALDDGSLTGLRNTAVGANALTNNTTGSFNTANGRSALVSNTTGSSNTANGQAALFTNTTGTQNTASGVNALQANTTASNNTAVGYNALFANTTGAQNTAIGRIAGLSNTTGTGNSFLGHAAGQFVTTGSNNTIIGRYDGNQGGLDIRTASNNIVLSDGDGNPRFHISSNGFIRASDSQPPGSSYTTENSHYFHNSTNSAVLRVNATNASYSDVMQYLNSTRTGSSSFFYLRSYSGDYNDQEFYVRGDGQVGADGSFFGGGADYAEYFEWADGNISNENRRGYTVVLDGNMIRKATSDDDASQIIGAVSSAPSVVGDADMDAWKGKYLKDDFGQYIRDENGERILNTDYSESQEYVSRENRPEWSPIGMMGKLRILKGQPVGDRWIKMRDVSDSVEEWLVR